MTHVTCELVQKAYAALATGKKEEVAKYWHQNMVWLVPGHNPLSGWYHGLDAFLGFMGTVGQMSGGSFHMDTVTIMVNDDYSCDVTRNRGTRGGNAELKLDIDVAHVLRWRDGKVIAGKGGIFGDGTDQYDHFWSTRV